MNTKEALIWKYLHNSSIICRWCYWLKSCVIYLSTRSVRLPVLSVTCLLWTPVLRIPLGSASFLWFVIKLPLGVHPQPEISHVIRFTVQCLISNHGIKLNWRLPFDLSVRGTQWETIVGNKPRSSSLHRWGCPIFTFFPPSFSSMSKFHFYKTGDWRFFLTPSTKLLPTKTISSWS